VAIRLHGDLTINSTNNRPKRRHRVQAEDAEAEGIHGRVGTSGVKSSGTAVRIAMAG